MKKSLKRVPIKWELTEEESALISDIADRVFQIWPGYPDDKMTLFMDITACHCNGNPLRLEDLLNADNFNFSHDIGGIRRHINRETGKLEDFFSPRFSRRSKT